MIDYDKAHYSKFSKIAKGLVTACDFQASKAYYTPIVRAEYTGAYIKRIDVTKIVQEMYKRGERNF